MHIKKTINVSPTSTPSNAKRVNSRSWFTQSILVFAKVHYSV